MGASAGIRASDVSRNRRSRLSKKTEVGGDLQESSRDAGTPRTRSDSLCRLVNVLIMQRESLTGWEETPMAYARENFQKILDELDLTDAERGYVQDADLAGTGSISQARAVGTLYAVKHAQQLVDRMIASNEKLARSNRRQALGLNILTGVLVLAVLAQVAVALAK